MSRNLPPLPAPPRLAIVGFLPDQRPLPRYMCILIEGLAEAGVEIDLLLPAGGPPDDLGLDRDVPVYPLEPEDDRSALADLRRYLGERAPQAILSNRDRSSALLARLSRQERPRTVLRIGTNVAEKLKGKHLVRRWWTRRRLADTFARADALIGISDGACDALRELLRGRRRPPIVRIYNPIDRTAFRRQAEEPISHPWFLHKEVPIVLSVGRLVRAKDYPTLLRAFRRVRERLDCRLVILGDGRQRKRLEGLVRSLDLTETVDLPGFAPNPFPYMARADLFVLSSRFEGFANVLAEALAVGTPCVATDCKSGPREILASGKYGRLVPTSDAHALADAILETIQQRPDQALLNEAIRRFDRDTAIGAYLEALRLRPPSIQDP